MYVSAVRPILDGYKSNLNIETGYLVTGNDKMDINYVARHRGVLTDTKINVSGVLRDHADKTFRGTIDFIKGCKEATGDEREDVLLMNEGVHNNTVPLILCAEEDVEGAHGASIGKISEDILLYMQSRGIPEEEITELMAKSRIAAVAGRILMKRHARCSSESNRYSKGSLNHLVLSAVRKNYEYRCKKNKRRFSVLRRNGSGVS